MGHTNIETTLNVYGHLLEDEETDKVTDVGLLGGYCQILVANLWQEPPKNRRNPPFFMHGVQGAGGSNLLAPTISKTIT